MMAGLSRASSLSRSASLSHAGLHELPLPLHPVRPFSASAAATALPPRHLAKQAHRSSRGPTSRSRRPVSVRAHLTGGGPGPGGRGGVLALLSDSCSKFLGRYDPVTIGTGSLLVTAYCYFVHGQSLEEALNLTFASTVVGMVGQEVLYNQQDDDMKTH